MIPRNQHVGPATLALALVLVPLPAAEASSPTETKDCGPVSVELIDPWRPAKESKFVASFEDFSPDFAVEPDEQWEQLGEHRTSSMLEVSTRVETRCDTNTCRTCVVAITARIGFTPSEIRLHENLRRNYCARRITRLHEEEHQAITRRAQAMVLEDARINLAWARSRHAAHVTPASRGEAGQEEVMHKVERDLMHALRRAVDYSDEANARLDRPERYRRESRRRWSNCRN